MLTASSRKAQVLSSRRVDGPQRNGSIRSCHRRVRSTAPPPRRSSSVSDHRLLHTHPSVTSVSVLAEFPDSCGKPRLIASALACHASQVANEDCHHWRRHRWHDLRIVAARRSHRRRGHLRVRDGVLKPRRHRQPAELEEIARTYKRTAGFDPETLNRPPSLSTSSFQHELSMSVDCRLTLGGSRMDAETPRLERSWQGQRALPG